MRRAVSTSGARQRGEWAQPITRRENTSNMTARYSHPCAVGIDVISPVHTRIWPFCCKILPEEVGSHRVLGVAFGGDGMERLAPGIHPVLEAGAAQCVYGSSASLGLATRQEYETSEPGVAHLAFFLTCILFYLL